MSERQPLIVTVLLYYGAKDRINQLASSRWQTINCPFHDDSHASARINVDLNAFKCNACPMSGDAVTLIQKKEGIDREKACEFARSVFGQSFENVSQPVPLRGKNKRRPLGNERWKKILE